MKLELKHLAPYLPYGLKFSDGVNIHELDEENLFGVVSDMRDLNTIKPILRPLSDLLKEEDFLGIQNLIRVHIGKNKLQKMCADGYGLVDLPYFITDYLFENHFDFFDLIEKGLAIDINSLES